MSFFTQFEYRVGGYLTSLIIFSFSLLNQLLKYNKLRRVSWTQDVPFYIKLMIEIMLWGGKNIIVFSLTFAH